MSEITSKRDTQQHAVISPANSAGIDLSDGISMRLLASGAQWDEALCTAVATFSPGASLPYHKHHFGEAIIVLDGHAQVSVEGRSYLLEMLDCIYIPKNVPHMAANVSAQNQLRLFSAFASSQRTRIPVHNTFPEIPRGYENPLPLDKEHIGRFGKTGEYMLTNGVRFVDLFAGRLGSAGICGGHGEFAPGKSLPCHTHDYGESITIVGGEALCLVAGARFSFCEGDSVFIPRGIPHRFINDSRQPMRMIWVYAGDEPTRTLADSALCSGQAQRSIRSNGDLEVE